MGTTLTWSSAKRMRPAVATPPTLLLALSCFRDPCMLAVGCAPPGLQVNTLFPRGCGWHGEDQETLWACRFTGAWPQWMVCMMAMGEGL